MRRHLSIVWVLLAFSILIGVRACHPGPMARPVLRVSWDESSWSLRYPEFVEVPLRIEVLHCPPAGPCPPRLSVHLRSSAGELVRTYDHLPPPCCGRGLHRHTLRIFQPVGSDPLPPGRYELSLGAYLRNRRFRVEGPNGAVERLVLGHVDVPAVADGDTLSAELTGGWGPPDRPADLQYPALRWFRGRARVELAAAPVHRTLLLHVGSPVPARGAPAPPGGGRIEVQASCTQDVLRLTYPGVHRRTLSIPAGRPCSLRLQSGPGHGGGDGAGHSRRSGFLAALSWRTAAGTERAARR